MSGMANRPQNVGGILQNNRTKSSIFSCNVGVQFNTRVVFGSPDNAKPFMRRGRKAAGLIAKMSGLQKDL